MAPGCTFSYPKSDLGPQSDGCILDKNYTVHLMLLVRPGLDHPRFGHAYMAKVQKNQPKSVSEPEKYFRPEYHFCLCDTQKPFTTHRDGGTGADTDSAVLVPGMLGKPPIHPHSRVIPTKKLHRLHICTGSEIRTTCFLESFQTNIKCTGIAQATRNPELTGPAN
jgi:hypothetical protein